MIVSNNSPLASIVFIFSFSKIIGMFFSFNNLTNFKQSMVFLANLLMDYVITISIFPVRQSLIISLKPSLFFVFVPDIPSSA